jgi:UDP-3-O-[3-hydroxymyristoyl] glucosamine N-acyltransferase
MPFSACLTTSSDRISPPIEMQYKMTIHPTAIVASDARIAPGVIVGPYSIIHSGVEIAEGVVIDAYCELGVPTNAASKPVLKIGHGCRIRSHAVIYSGSTLGSGVQLGHYVSIRENSQIGVGAMIGTRSQVEGDCEIGEYSRLHSEVHVGKAARIGRCCLLYPKVQFTNDPLPPTHVMIPVIIHDLAVVCTGALLFPGVEIRLGAFIGAASVVRESVPPVTFASGNPARSLFKVDRLMDPERNIKFQWLEHFRDRYPAEAQSLITQLTDQARALCIGK